MTGTKHTLITVKGTVQGVFFRAKTKKHADALGLKGSVRNLPNGAVEIIVQGSDPDTLIAQLKKEPLPIQIDEITMEMISPTKKYTEFLIIE